MSQIEKILSQLSEIQICIETTFKAARENKSAENIELIKTKIAEISRVFSESADVLPSYERRKTQSLLQNYTAELSKLTEIKAKKFGFRKAEVAPKKDVVDGVKLSVVKDGAVEAKVLPQFSVEKLQGGKKVVDHCLNQDVHITDCTDTEIVIDGAPGNLHISKLRDCTIFASPVKTSIFIDDCHNCKFVLACQQLRMHSSYEITVYLHVASRAIIEDCKNVKFAPLPLQFAKNFEICGFLLDCESFKKVDDFNWLSKGPSPNWSVLPEEQRESLE